MALAGILAKEWLCEGTAGPRGPFLAMLPWDAEWPPEGEQEQEHCLWWSEAQVDAVFPLDTFCSCYTCNWSSSFNPQFRTSHITYADVCQIQIQEAIKLGKRGQV